MIINIKYFDNTKKNIVTGILVEGKNKGFPSFFESYSIRLGKKEDGSMISNPNFDLQKSKDNAILSIDRKLVNLSIKKNELERMYGSEEVMNFVILELKSKILELNTRKQYILDLE